MSGTEPSNAGKRQAQRLVLGALVGMLLGLLLGTLVDQSLAGAGFGISLGTIGGLLYDAIRRRR